MLEQQNLLHKNALFGLRRRKKEQSLFEKRKQLYFHLSIILGLIIIGAVYFTLDISNVYRITVEGNVYLRDEDVIEASELKTSDKYLLLLPFAAENKVENNPLIRECSIRRLDNRLVQINVVEKKAYAYIAKADSYQLILEDDERIDLDENNRYLIGYVPVIDGFTEDEIILIENNLKECDYRVIDEISEIRKYPDLKYQNVELIMRDGNYIFTSPYGLKILNYYHSIQSSYVSNKQICYYFEDISGNAYSSACPWEIVEEQETEEAGEDEYYDVDE